MQTNTTKPWPAELHRALRDLDIRQLAYVPDAGHKRLLELAAEDNSMRAIALTTEEEGIAVGAGAWLGGERSVVLMQSSGVGNCVNAIASITQACRFPLLLLVTMRGEWGEGNPWQVPMGSAVTPILETLGVKVTRLEEAEDAYATLNAAGVLCFSGGAPAAVLIAQRLIGAKAFKQ